MKEKIKSLLEQIGPELDDLSRKIYENPELGGQEYEACRLHTELLRKYGFTVETPFSGVETGFKAVFDTGKPGLSIAFLAEYDALPEIGHGCAHNLLGTTSPGGGIILRHCIEDIGGRVIVFGTPAEETNGAKVVYAEHNEFAGIDLALIAHPHNRSVKSGLSLALEPIEFEFIGKSAHAASSPEEGINALDAALITMTAINALREHIRDDSRVHGIVANGGAAANIVPDYAKLQYYVRSTKKSYNQQLLEKVKNCARAGALATGCELRMNKFEYSYDNLLTNQALSRVFVKHYEELTGMTMAEPPAVCASLDTGQVSQFCPTIHPDYDITGWDTSIVGHSRELAAASVSEYAKEQMRHVITAFVLTALEVMTDKSVYEEIRQEFEASEK